MVVVSDDGNAHSQKPQIRRHFLPKLKVESTTHKNSKTST